MLRKGLVKKYIVSNRSKQGLEIDISKITSEKIMWLNKTDPMILWIYFYIIYTLFWPYNHVIVKKKLIVTFCIYRVQDLDFKMFKIETIMSGCPKLCFKDVLHFCNLLLNLSILLYISLSLMCIYSYIWALPIIVAAPNCNQNPRWKMISWLIFFSIFGM